MHLNDGIFNDKNIEMMEYSIIKIFKYIIFNSICYRIFNNNNFNLVT